MRITQTLVDKLLRLKRGESIPASSLRGDWVEELLRDGVIVNVSHGSRRTISASSPSMLEKSLSLYDERFADLEKMKILIGNAESRFEQANNTGNSKLVQTRTCPGFLINSYEPIKCQLHNSEFIVNPPEGSYVFIADWHEFTIPEDVIVIGIENMENFRLIRQQRIFFENEMSADKQLLFVSRYPQSTDLRQWLCNIPNRYIHFGDFDLAGINIFLTEFYPYLEDRSSFFIPSDIESRLEKGSSERYTLQYQKFKNLNTSIPGLQNLVQMIHCFHRCYDQEGYIKS